MFSLVRKVVAGPKRTTVYEGRQLDLTYISERIIAMAFPASDIIEKTYRNKIEDVARYLSESHGDHYLVLNVSSRTYDYSPFEERVRDYEWADHQAPTLTTLVHIAHQVAAFLLANQENIVAVHCNHGKGRTGTAIISFLLFIGYYESTADCLKFYNERRFSKDTYGVDQPCQVRYLNFIEKLMKSPKVSPKLICYRLQKISHRGLSESYYVKIRNTRSQETIFERVNLNEQMGQKCSNRLLISDIFIEIFNDSWMGQKKVARINYNLYFTQNTMNLTFKGKDIKLSDHHTEDFEITFHLQYYCLCHLPIYEHTKCKCEALRNIEEDYWAQMINHIREIKNMPAEDRLQLVHGQGKQDPKSSMRGKRESNESSSEEVEMQYKELKKKKSKEFKNSHQQKLYTLVKNTRSKKMIYEQQDSKQQVNRETSDKSPTPTIQNPSNLPLNMGEDLIKLSQSEQ